MPMVLLPSAEVGEVYISGVFVIYAHYSNHILFRSVPIAQGSST